VHIGAFVTELKQRRVIRAVVVWGIVAFAVLQVYEAVMHGLHLPEWTLSFVVVVLGLGFPVTITLAWIFDLSARGVSRAPSTEANELKGARVTLVLVTLGFLAASPGIAWYFLRMPAERPPPIAPTTPSIAVLPFADMSPGKDQEYLSDGIAEEILNSLAQVGGLRVIGRTSSFSFKGKNEDLRSIGEKLGVAHLLEGSVRRSGTRIRVTTQLVEAGRGSHLWSQIYDRELTDVFEVQDEIAKSVVAALKLRFGTSSESSAQDRHTTNLEAYQQYLLGEHFRKRASEDGNRRAIEAYEKAVALDPGYSPAWVGLSQARSDRANTFAASLSALLDDLELSHRAAEKAVALDPGSGRAYGARGNARIYNKWDWAGGHADLDRAIALNPGDAEIQALYGRALIGLGRVGDHGVVAALQRATELDPLNAWSWLNLSWSYLVAGQFRAARTATERAMEVSPDFEFGKCFLGDISLVEGRPDTALDWYVRCPVEWKRFPGIAMAQHDLGRSDESNIALETVISRFAGVAAMQVAEVHAWRGEGDAAFDWLDRAHSQRDTGVSNVKVDLLLRNLHGDPRYNAFLKKLNLPVD